ncbi:TetR family transcriptional regulator [Bosea sp. OK403]|nr:TetR family transcriptional regulator [Bosea sp. OK403]
MDAVSAEAGVSRRRLYTRFPAKSQLFEAVIGT